MILLTIFLPPVAVAIKQGIGVQFLINGTTMILNDPAFWSGLAEAIRAR
jgi:uncharacterized membrane protein YqaE (UPF0057 family)